MTTSESVYRVYVAAAHHYIVIPLQPRRFIPKVNRPSMQA